MPGFVRSSVPISSDELSLAIFCMEKCPNRCVNLYGSDHAVSAFTD